MISVQLIYNERLYIFGCDRVEVIKVITPIYDVIYRADFIDIREFSEPIPVSQMKNQYASWRIDGVFHIFHNSTITVSCLPDYIAVQSQDYEIQDLRKRVFFNSDLDNSKITDFML